MTVVPSSWRDSCRASYSRPSTATLMPPQLVRRRKYGNRLNLQERPSRASPEIAMGTGRSVAVLQIAVAHLAEDWQILGVEEVVVEFDDVLELRRPPPARLSGSRTFAPLAGESRCSVCRRGRARAGRRYRRGGRGRGLDHVGVAGRLGQGLLDSMKRIWFTVSPFAGIVDFSHDLRSNSRPNQYVTRKSAILFSAVQHS